MSRNSFKTLALIGGVLIAAAGCAVEGVDGPSFDDEPDVMDLLDPSGLDEPPSAADPDALSVLATVAAATVSDGDMHFPVASMTLRYQTGKPAAGVRVTGSFLGDVNDRLVGVTDETGALELWAEPRNGHMLLGFVIESAEYAVGDRWRRSILEGGYTLPHQCSHGQPAN